MTTNLEEITKLNLRTVKGFTVLITEEVSNQDLLPLINQLMRIKEVKELSPIYSEE